MATSTLQRTASLRFPSDLFETLKMRAKESNRSLNSYVIGLLSDAVSEQSNPVTIAAIEEARSGKSAGIADTSSIDAFIKSCSE